MCCTVHNKTVTVRRLTAARVPQKRRIQPERYAGLLMGIDVMVFLLRNTKYNIILSTLFHVSINIGFTVLFTDGFGNIKLFLINSALWLVAVVIITKYGRKYYFKKVKDI